MTLPQRSCKEIQRWQSGIQEQRFEIQSPQSRHPSCVPVDIQHSLYPFIAIYCLRLLRIYCNNMTLHKVSGRTKIVSPWCRRCDSCGRRLKNGEDASLDPEILASLVSERADLVEWADVPRLAATIWTSTNPQIVPWVWCLPLDEIVTLQIRTSHTVGRCYFDVYDIRMYIYTWLHIMYMCVFCYIYIYFLCFFLL